MNGHLEFFLNLQISTFLIFNQFSQICVLKKFRYNICILIANKFLIYIIEMPKTLEEKTYGPKRYCLQPAMDLKGISSSPGLPLSPVPCNISTSLQSSTTGQNTIKQLQQSSIGLGKLMNLRLGLRVINMLIIIDRFCFSII